MPRGSFAHALAKLSRNSRDLDVLLPGSRNHFQGLRDGSVDESLSLQDPGASNGIH
jgi:hypothetical protein